MTIFGTVTQVLKSRVSNWSTRRPDPTRDEVSTSSIFGPTIYAETVWPIAIIVGVTHVEEERVSWGSATPCYKAMGPFNYPKSRTPTYAHSV